MRIDCPSCGAAYQVPDAVLATRRVVRCARCAKDWAPGVFKPQLRIEADPAPALASGSDEVLEDANSLAQPGSDLAAAEAPSFGSEPLRQPEPQPAFTPPAFLTRPLPKAPPPPAARSAVVYAWAASVALIAALGVSAITWRGPVMHAWPASARLYAAIGMG